MSESTLVLKPIKNPLSPFKSNKLLFAKTSSFLAKIVEFKSSFLILSSTSLISRVIPLSNKRAVFSLVFMTS